VKNKAFTLSILLGAVFAFVAAPGWAQEYTKSDRELAAAMLRDADADVRKNYYDPKLHGVDWQQRVQETKKKIEAAQSMNAAVSEVAALLDTLHDSHTYLVLPPRTHAHDYGFQMEMIGSRCFVIRVRSGSDAERKGLKAGDEILAVNEYPVSRKNFWRIVYIFNSLRPQPGLQLTLADGAGHQRLLEVITKFQLSTVNAYFIPQGINVRVRDADEEQRLLRARYFEKGGDLLVVKIPQFNFSAYETDTIIAKMRAHKGVVLDLRGNSGGYLDTLERLLGGLFQNDLKIFDHVGRTSTKAMSVTGRHRDAFTGRFAILIDSESASASELLARVVQLEKRGFIVGDRSSGRVMEAIHYRHEVSVDSRVSYFFSVAEADLLMADGNSLEHVGVEPDFIVLPTDRDLASNRDPAMSKAAGLVGVQLSPDEAGSILPYEEPGLIERSLSLTN
jgi:carboxyl-terminal processing protease